MHTKLTTAVVAVLLAIPLLDYTGVWDSRIAPAIDSFNGQRADNKRVLSFVSNGTVRTIDLGKTGQSAMRPNKIFSCRAEIDLDNGDAVAVYWEDNFTYDLRTITSGEFNRCRLLARGSKVKVYTYGGHFYTR